MNLLDHAQQLRYRSSRRLECPSIIDQHVILLQFTQTYFNSLNMPVRGKIKYTPHHFPLIPRQVRWIPIQHLSQTCYTCALHKALPEFFPDVLDSVDTQGIDLESGNEMVNPGVERGDDMWGFGVEVGGL